MDIAPQDGARAAILRHELVPVLEEPGRSRRAGHLVEPPQRNVANARALRARGSHQTVLNIVGERRRAIRGEVTVGYIRLDLRTRRALLVTVVRRLSAVAM